MKRIFTAGNLPEAYLVRDLLRQAGVAVHVFNEHAMAALGEVPGSERLRTRWYRAVATATNDFKDRGDAANQHQNNERNATQISCVRCRGARRYCD